MPKFNYILKSGPQSVIRGVIEAQTQQEAINRLNQEGNFPISVEPQDTYLEKSGALKMRSISRKEIALFTRQLSTLVASGVNVLASLNIIFTQESNRNLKFVISDIVAKVKDGRTLSESFAAYPKLFPALYSSMIKAGEMSGNLSEILRRLADFLEKEEEFKNSIRASLIYPLFIFAVGLLTVIVLLVFVIPRLVNMFEDMGQLLPVPTKILISISSFLNHYWWLILICLSLFWLTLQRYYKSMQGKFTLDNFKLKLAILGNLTLKSEISRLSRTLALLLSSGIAIVPSLEVSSSVLENSVLKSEIAGFKNDISAGINLSTAFKKSKFFPEFVTSLITIGEQTGALDKSLLRIADDYEKEVDRTLKALTRMLEPIIILVMGLLVGFIVLSMLLPIFQINLIVT
jgi:type II secretory pathway component PulF